MSPQRRAWFQWRSPRSRARAVRRLSWGVEQLEGRQLLAGNVAAVIADGNLTLTGDDAANSVEVTQTAAGIVVRGLAGTTINGSASAFTVVAGQSTLSGNLKIDLAAGDDAALIAGAFTIAGDVEVHAGNGTDRIGFDGVTVDGDVIVHGGHDASLVQIDDAEIGGDVRLDVGVGDTTLVIKNAKVGDDLRIRTRSGAAAVAIQNSEIGDNARLKLGRNDDSVQFDEVTIGGKVRVRTGSGDDFVMFDTVDIDGRTQVQLKNGDDDLVLSGTNSFAKQFQAEGGHGDDAQDVAAGSTFTGGQKARHIEGDDVPASVIQSELNDATSGLLTRATALQAFFDGLASNALPLTLDVSSNQPISSNGTQIVGAASFVIRATTTPGATVKVDRDGNSAFDDGEAVANAQGLAVITVTLLNNAANRGANVLQVRSTLGSGETTQTLNVHYAVGDVVRFDTSAGAFDVELLNADAPNTVENFLDYRTRFAGSILHRSARNADGSDFIIQGGGFGAPPNLTAITTDPAINTEFKAANSNVRGTLSMALPPGNPNGGTSQWFINTANNAFLDAAQHTVFGRVIGSGMTIVDAIHDLTAFNLVGVYNNAALSTVPLTNYTAFTQNLTGTATVAAGATQVTGTGTQFTTELKVGGAIQIGTQTFTVSAIASNTQLTLSQAHTAGATA
ncbi:MAG: peptidylprolyl isomerase, partial [Planctomycetaceae bacterium]|nr:peptidylprolyl isomerase [Planctomycetaceae bacterium]